MKKVGAYGVLLALAVALFGCSGSDSSEDPTDSIPSLKSIPDQDSGSLAAMKIAVSPAYGVNYYSSANNYQFQRSVVNDIRADLYTQEFCFRYLYPSLERCGGSVIALRDRNRTRIGISGYEAWKESALLYLTHIGAAAASIASISDPAIRPWHAINMGADCYLYISLNNSGVVPPPISARGTTLYVWTNQTDHTTVTDFSHLPPNSAELTNTIYSRLCDAAAVVDPTWRRRGILSGNFATLRVLKEQHEAGTAHIPGVLVELGFADNTLDAEQLKTPAMMATMARALTVSIIDSITANSGLYPPVRPSDVSVFPVDGYLNVSWITGDDPYDESSSAPTSYVIKVFSEDRTYLGSQQVPAGSLSAQIPMDRAGTFIITVSARNAYGESIDSDEISVVY